MTQAILVGLFIQKLKTTTSFRQKGDQLKLWRICKHSNNIYCALFCGSMRDVYFTLGIPSSSLHSTEWALRVWRLVLSVNLHTSIFVFSDNQSRWDIFSAIYESKSFIALCYDTNLIVACFILLISLKYYEVLWI